MDLRAGGSQVPGAIERLVTVEERGAKGRRRRRRRRERERRFSRLLVLR